MAYIVAERAAEPRQDSPAGNHHCLSFLTNLAHTRCAATRIVSSGWWVEGTALPSSAVASSDMVGKAGKWLDTGGERG